MSTMVPPHAHTGGHLLPGGVQRCGCSRPTPEPARIPFSPALTDWAPVRGQHTGFVRAHFIYSDRMARLGA